MYWPRLFARNVMFAHYDVCRQGVEIDPYVKFRFPQFVSLSVTRTYVLHKPIKMYRLKLFFVVFQEMHSLHYTHYAV